MFARSYVYLDRPYPEVRAVVLRSPGRWLADLDSDSAEQLLGKVGVRVVGVPLYRRVRLLLGQPTGDGPTPRVLFPVCWQPIGGEPLFPDMEGELQIEAFGVERTQLTLSANYRPPMGAVGRAIDMALMHRLADATIHDFVQRLAAGIEHLLDERLAATPPG